MGYSIGGASQKAGISASTIRYYEKEGLLPSIKRDKNGIRSFTDEDLQSLKIIECLKATGMPIKDIRKFINLCADGDNSLQERYELFLDRKAVVQKQISELKEVEKMIDFKCWYYKTAIEAGTEKIHANKSEIISTV